jgi:phage terminase large subunit GpA-like protein
MSSKDLKHVICPQCKKEFTLIWGDGLSCYDRFDTLILRGCPSGGIYDVRIKCPHCDYEEEL